MRQKDWVAASQPLHEVLAGFRRMRSGFVKATSEWVVAGLSADSSAHSRTTFYLEAFALPLYIPTTHLYYSFGFRIGHSWEEVDSQTVAEVRKAVPRLLKLADLRAMVKECSNWRIDPHHLEIRLGAGIILDDRRFVEEVRKALPMWRFEQDWEHEIVDRCAELLTLLDTKGKDAAVSELARRREVTMAVLS